MDKRESLRFSGSFRLGRLVERPLYTVLSLSGDDDDSSSCGGVRRRRRSGDDCTGTLSFAAFSAVRRRGTSGGIGSRFVAVDVGIVAVLVEDV